MVKGNVLVLDPSLRYTGWLVVSGGVPVIHGCIETKATAKKYNVRQGDADTDDILEIQRQLRILVKNYSIDLVVAEESAGSTKGTRGTKTLAYAKAIVCGLSGFLEVPLGIVWIRYDHIKLTVGGKKTATKAEIQQAVQAYWPEYEWPKIGKGKDTVSKPVLEAVCDAAAVYLRALEVDPTVRVLARKV